MPLIAQLVNKLRVNYPALTFCEGDMFRWDHVNATIFYTTRNNDCGSLLHEVGHAILDHKSYQRDIQLVAIERDAWEYARTTLGPQYNVTVGETTVDDAMDSYREWLHTRSQCPDCQATGIQDSDSYQCLSCQTIWRSNDAKHCALRRYKKRT